MRKFQTLVGIVTAVLATAGVASAADGPKQDLATGTGHFTVEGVEFDVHVNAKSGALGEDAKGHFFIRLADTPAVPGGLSLSGSVTCLTVVGNAATVGGVVESTDSPQIPEGSGILIGIIAERASRSRLREFLRKVSLIVGQARASDGYIHFGGGG